MKKIVFVLLLCGTCCNAFAISSSQLVSCTAGTLQTACSQYQSTYCNGQAITCGTVVLDGTTYTNKCKCLSCASGTSLPSSTAPHCVCNTCTSNRTTDTSTHLVTVKYTSSSTTQCFSDITSTAPTTLASFCSRKAATYECASGYGSFTTPKSTTTCYSCDAQLISTDNGDSFSAGTYSPTNAVYISNGKYYFKSWNANSWAGPTSAPKEVSPTTLCGACASDCWYVSPILLKYGTAYYGIILNGCPLRYATTSCSATATGCANAVKSKLYASCVCNSKYYGTTADACGACPEDESGLQTSAVGAQTATQCYIPAEQSISDATGEFTYESSCYYSS